VPELSLSIYWGLTAGIVVLAGYTLCKGLSWFARKYWEAMESELDRLPPEQRAARIDAARDSMMDPYPTSHWL